MATCYTWCCDQPGCYWQASSYDRDEAHEWSTEHTDERSHPTSLYIEEEDDEVVAGYQKLAAQHDELESQRRRDRRDRIRALRHDCLIDAKHHDDERLS